MSRRIAVDINQFLMRWLRCSPRGWHENIYSEVDGVRVSYCTLCGTMQYDADGDGRNWQTF